MPRLSDDELSLRQRIRTRYFRLLAGSLAFLLGIAGVRIAYSDVVLPPIEGYFFLVWLFLILGNIWLLCDFIGVMDLRRWIQHW